MRSYAQHAEDARLARALGSRPTGFYVDVGAAHPVINSVTKHFYDRGWRGINVEPDPALFGLLEATRPRDVNLPVALSDMEGSGILHLFDGVHGLATLQEDVVLRYGHEFGMQAVTKQVRVTTLRNICEQHVAGGIDFIKIDAEGHERKVILGSDWQRWRPTIVVVEATEPWSTAPSHQQWEHLLLNAAYELALFDGLNRFYVAEESCDLIPAVTAPFSPLDNIEPDAYLRRIEQLEKELEEANSQIAQRRPQT
jgi:FkbM family methyltransferase